MDSGAAFVANSCWNRKRNSTCGATSKMTVDDSKQLEVNKVNVDGVVPVLNFYDDERFLARARNDTPKQLVISNLRQGSG